MMPGRVFGQEITSSANTGNESVMKANIPNAAVVKQADGPD